MPGDGRVQRVRKRIAKELSQILIHHARRDVVDHLLDQRGRKGPAFYRRALEGEVERTAAERRTITDAPLSIICSGSRGKSTLTVESPHKW